MKRCEECGAAFEGKESKRFCSERCQHRNARKRARGILPPKECRTCRQWFTPQTKRQIYCSDNCKPKKEISDLLPRKCEQCRQYYTPYTKTQRFCSSDCRKEAMTPRRHKSCLWCGVVFETKNGWQKYCSPKCRNAANNEREKARRTPKAPKACAICGKVFVPRSGTQKYCGPNCQNIALSKGSQKPYSIDGKNRPFTRDTVYLINKWHREGMSVDNLAKMLNRSRESVLKALKEGGVQV